MHDMAPDTRIFASLIVLVFLLPFPFLYELRLERRHGVLAVLENWNRCFDGLHGVAVIRLPITS